MRASAGVKVRFEIGFMGWGRTGLGLGESLNRADVWVRLGLRLEVGLASAARERLGWGQGWGQGQQVALPSPPAQG